MGDRYKVEAACFFTADPHGDEEDPFLDAAQQAEGWASDPYRDSIVWRVTNERTGESRLIDLDTITA